MTNAKKAPKTLKHYQEAGSKLENLPTLNDDEREVTLQEGLKVILPQVRALQKKGYSLEKIGEALRSVGIDIKNSTLKNYLSAGKSRKKKTAKPTVAENQDNPKIPKTNPEPTKPEASKAASKPEAPKATTNPSQSPKGASQKV
jgi:hypothetical protein